ncbi:hypothetical protein nbrc107696_05130 [Gordonia spumicola]|uniref:Uncharacterized protein n=1 Tax=Gordonia spumicola TaxID=589161 RepID=A0A7I9V4B4_9ACTN|nr:hypothetical protein [Gordonia spumicola]GEE00067.1 hypothetical protein nbrc107696_05130 [Gordonia spumicola]
MHAPTAGSGGRCTTFDAGRPRGVATAALVALILYGAFRIGLQLVAGLDPSFTVNAWGGPTYVGALAAHLLDAVALMSAAAWALDKIMLDDH